MLIIKGDIWSRSKKHKARETDTGTYKNTGKNILSGKTSLNTKWEKDTK